jgi:hypothetical protein
VPPNGTTVLYELAPSVRGPAVYLGQTRRGVRDRFSTHLSLARHHAGKNRPLEAWLRRRAKRRQPVVIRIIALHPAGDAADDAERAAIAALRETLGPRLLNQGPGGEKAPAGRMVSEEERQRRAVRQRLRQRTLGYRLLQSLACCRRRHQPGAYNALLQDFAAADPGVTALEICRRHGLAETALITLLTGRSNGLVVRADLLALARDAQARRDAARRAKDDRIREVVEAFLVSPPATALAEIARAHGLDPRRIQECLRRRQRGIPDDLAAAARTRMREDLRLRGRQLGRRSARLDRTQLRWLLTAYSRPGSRLTLAGIASRLGATQAAISHLIAGRAGQPLPRRLVLACKARARAASRAALRAPLPPSQATQATTNIARTVEPR